MEIIIGLTIVGTVYCLPYIVAVIRNLANRKSILLLNLLTGWTVLGWIAALIWAATAQGPVSTLRVEVLAPRNRT